MVSIQWLLIFSEKDTSPKSKSSKLITCISGHKAFSIICFSIRAVLKLVICTFCGFNFSSFYQLPDFWGLSQVFLPIEWVSWFLCVFKKKTQNQFISQLGVRSALKKTTRCSLASFVTTTLTPHCSGVPWADLLPSTSPRLTHSPTGPSGFPTLDHKTLSMQSLLQTFIFPPCSNWNLMN